MRAEPFRIKMIERIAQLSLDERRARIREAGYNVFNLRSQDVYIDLLTDSGTGAMSDAQWGAMMTGDEAYAGSRSFQILQKTVAELFGYPHVLPTHQGRAAEHVLLPLFKDKSGRKDQLVAGNMHFDTTRAHIELAGLRPVDLIGDEAFVTDQPQPFKGNVDLAKLERLIADQGSDAVACFIMTITCNGAGGQPVSLQNIRETAALCREHDIPFVFDAARFAQNAYFIQQREPGQNGRSIRDIVREMFSYGDAFMMSAKKDGLVNIGGLVAIRSNADWFDAAKARLVPYEGFLTYGGLAGRDLAALAQGLQEAVDEEFLAYRTDQVGYLGERLAHAGIPVQLPIGGHAVFVDAKRLLPHIPARQFPAQALAVAVYEEAGVRSVEVGSFMLGRDPETGEPLTAPAEFLRLAVPARTYTYRHMDVVAEAFSRLRERQRGIQGLRIVAEPAVLRHFTARLEPLAGVGAAGV